jgi:hypothetical protein
MVNFGSVTRRGAAACASLASLLLLAAPIERAFAVGPPSMPITVTNPTTSPVPTTVVNPSTSPALTSSVDNPGRVAYQSTQTLDCTTSNGCGLLGFSVVPSGHRLVIQHASGLALITGTPSSALVELGTASPQSHDLTTILSSFFAPFAGGSISFNQPVLIYIDSGSDRPGMSFSLTPGTAQFTSTIIITLTGYLLDCTNIHCATIAH